MVEDCANFLKVINNLKPYIIEFEEDGTMKAKIYLNNYTSKRLKLAADYSNHL